jgi:hypothetical protein
VFQSPDAPVQCNRNGRGSRGRGRGIRERGTVGRGRLVAGRSGLQKGDLGQGKAGPSPSALRVRMTRLWGSGGVGEWGVHPPLPHSRLGHSCIRVCGFHRAAGGEGCPARWDAGGGGRVYLLSSNLLFIRRNGFLAVGGQKWPVLRRLGEGRLEWLVEVVHRYNYIYNYTVTVI